MVAEIGSGWNVPEDVAPAEAWSWYHVRPGAALKLVVTCESPVWYPGHFVRGRMVRCRREGCAECAAGVGVQLRYVMSMARYEDGRQGLMELGRSPGEQIRDWVARHGGLRGMVLVFGRYSMSRQSRIEVEYCDEEAPGWLADVVAPDIREILRVTWEKEARRRQDVGGGDDGRGLVPGLKEVLARQG